MPRHITTRGAEVVRRLIDIGKMLTSGAELDERVTELLRRGTELFECERCSIMLWDGEYYRGTYNWGNPPEFEANFLNYRVAAGAPVVVEAYEGGAFIVIEDARQHPATRKIAEHADIASVVIAPMSDFGGERLGFMTAEFSERTKIDGPLAEAVAGVASLAQATLISRRDRREREAAERDRSRMLNELAWVEQRERQRISNDIHDDVLQRVTSIGHFLEVVADDIADPEQQQQVRRLQAETREAAASLRRLVQDLHPLAVEVGTLPSAISGLVERATEMTGVDVDLRVRGPGRPSIEQSSGVYRIAQQALDNVAAHAAAGNVQVNLSLDVDGIRLEVIDDGVGFERGGVSPKRIGLFSMTQRAERLGGSCTVWSRPGEGTTVRAFVPNLRHESDGDASESDGGSANT